MRQGLRETPDTGWRRANLLAVALVLALSIWSVVGLADFFAIPTDGWFLRQPDSFGQISFVYRENLMGAPSGLQPGDHLVAIEGHTTTDDLAKIADRWQADYRMRYTVERGDPTQDVARVDVMVPLVNWQVGPALIYVVRQIGVGLLLGDILFAAIAIFVFLRRPRDSAARVMFVYAMLSLTIATLGKVGNSNPATALSATAGPISIITILLSYTVLYPPIQLHFAMVFPRPKPIVLRRRFLIPALYLVGVSVMIGVVMTFNFLLPYTWMFVSYVGAILILIHSAFTMRDAISRAQLLWGLFGVIVSLLMQSLSFLITFRVVTGPLAAVLDFVFGMSSAVLGITLGIAVLRYRLFDINVIFRRTLIYGALTLMLGAMYVGLVTVLQQGVVLLTGNGDSQLVTVASTLAVAAAFLPLRNRIQQVIDRRFFRRQYNAEQVATRFSAEMRDAVSMDEVTAKLFDAVDDTIQPHKVMLWLADGDTDVKVG